MIKDETQEIKQRLFNNGYIGLAKQARWGKNSGFDGFAYRGYKCSKSFIGFSISDFAYSEELENKNAGHELVQNAIIKSGYDIFVIPNSDKFIRRMQFQCHDSRINFEFSLVPARKFARKHGLTIPRIGKD